MTTRADMAAFGASEIACYKWPKDTAEHKALRQAFCDGAAAEATRGMARNGEKMTQDALAIARSYKRNREHLIGALRKARLPSQWLIGWDAKVERILKLEK